MAATSLDRRLPLVAAIALLAALLTAVAAVQFSTGSSAAGIQGDVDCDDDADSVDALFDLRYVAQIEPFADCVEAAGDTDCSGDIESADALRILRHAAGMPALPAPAGCPRVGEPLDATDTPSATPGPTPTLYTPFPPFTVTPTPTATPTPVPTVTATPEPGGYALAHVMPDADFERMVDFTTIPGANGEAIVVLQKADQIWRVSLTGAFAPTLYGDLSTYVGGDGDEEGLLSAAFSPDFGTDGRIYVYYTRGGDSDLPTTLARFPVVGNLMDTSQKTVVLEVPDFASNHNGGKIAFGPDGYLYLSTGDGGGGGDPQESGQDKDSLRGKVLRIDVTGQTTYAVPADNPFVGAAGRDEIWAYGLRNPWRMSFDRVTGDLWLGDVGQGDWEEVDRIVKGGNYGWDCYEGFVEYEPDGCPSSGFESPRAVYDHNDGLAVTGGYVYRGSDLPELYGWYAYGDAYSGKIWAVDGTPGATSAPVLLLDSDAFISSFAELPDGELLIITFDNAIYELQRAP